MKSSYASSIAEKEIDQKSYLTKLLQIELKIVDTLKNDYLNIINASPNNEPESGSFGHYNNKHPALALAHLYTFDHPLNPYFKSPEIIDMVKNLIDKWAEAGVDGKNRGVPMVTSEWPIYATSEIYDMLKEELEPNRKKAWKEFVVQYLDASLKKPFGMTAPNHEIWRVNAFYSAGKTFHKPEWCAAGVFFGKQLLELQTPEGFWEEGIHHGPSMRYNSVMLTGLANLYQKSGVTEFKTAAIHLSTFMTTYTFPDAIIPGTFDGRQSSSLAFYTPVCPGLEFIPEGRTMNKKGVDLWLEAGALDNLQNASNSKWYLYFGSFFMGVAFRYYLDMLAKDEQEKAFGISSLLPMDNDIRLENHSSTFDGLMFRKGPWALALSSQNSEVPNIAKSIFRLERQSRIEIWHRDARLIMGGGHNLRTNPIPLANVILDTGFAGPTKAGFVDQEKDSDRRHYYIPRKVFTSFKDGVPNLKEIFAHGTVEFSFNFRNAKEVEINVQWDILKADRIALQFPLIVWRQAKVSINEKEIQSINADTPINGNVKIQGGIFNSSYEFQTPKGVTTFARYPVKTLQMYNGDFSNEEHVVSPFQMITLTCEWENPQKTASHNFLYKIL